MKSRLSKLLMWLAIPMLLGSLYVGAYASLLTGKQHWGDGQRPSYRIEGFTVGVLLKPIHLIDRLLRKEYWNPTSCHCRPDGCLILAETNNLGIPWKKLVYITPPMPTINGVVMGVKWDVAQPLILLSVGKNEQVEVGFTFYIFRGNQFIGQVVVEKVLPNNAACRIVFTKNNAPILEGDIAATRV